MKLWDLESATLLERFVHPRRCLTKVVLGGGHENALALPRMLFRMMKMPPYTSCCPSPRNARGGTTSASQQAHTMLLCNRQVLAPACYLPSPVPDGVLSRAKSCTELLARPSASLSLYPYADAGGEWHGFM